VPRGPTEARKPCILVVDDEPMMQELLRDMVADCASYVDTAGSVAHASKLLSHVTYDIALLDNRLGDGNGLDLLRLIRQRARHTRVIMITSDARKPDFIRQATEDGAEKVIGKPFQHGEILDLLAMPAGGGEG
jgi:CheY-like chemotaxis protein